MENKKALITGICGQDGSYLLELLLSKGYEVHGIIRWDSVSTNQRIDHILQDPNVAGTKLFLHHGDLTDSGVIGKLINQIKPNEVYHLGAMSHVKVSFDMPEYTANTDALGTLRILEAIKNSGLPIKFYMAASSEMFGESTPSQNENTPFNPKSPYACAKIFSYHITKIYRDAHNIDAWNGILFNHESPRRGQAFVTKKITTAVARIKAGLENKVYLGNIEAQRDWGYAPEYIEAMWLMLQQPRPGDFIVATNESHSVKDFLQLAFKYAGLGDWKKYAQIDFKYLRPTEINILRGDYSKVKNELNWSPKIKFEELVKIMVDADFRAQGVKSIGEGDKIVEERFLNKWWKVD